MKSLIRTLTHIGFHPGLRHYEMKRVLVFNYCNFFGFLASVSRVIYITFFSPNPYTLLTILANLLPLLICVTMSVFLHYRKYAATTLISFICFPPALLAIYVTTLDPYINFFLVLYLIFPFFFLHKPINIIWSFSIAILCMLLATSASTLELQVYSKSVYRFDSTLAYIDCFFSVGFIFGALYCIKFLVWSYEKSLRQKKSELKELNHFKNKMLSIISHDLRSPLAGVSQLLDLVKKTPMEQEEFADYVKQLNTQVNVTRELIDNLLDWTKMQIEEQSIAPAPIRLSEIVDNTFEVVNKQAVDKKVALINEIDTNTIALVDKHMITVVVRNLLSNAIKFTKAGDWVKTKVAQISDDYVVLEVADNGVGIPLEKQAMIFGSDHFSTYGTSNEKGTGLGLNICKDLVEKNSGTLTFKSIPGTGTSFYVTLPVFKQQVYTADALHTPGISPIPGYLRAV